MRCIKRRPLHKRHESNHRKPNMLKNLFAFVIHTTSLLDYLDISEVRNLQRAFPQFIIGNSILLNFKDEAVHRAIRDRLKKIRTSFSELDQIRCLKLKFPKQVLSPVEQLDGLECFYNLSSIHLSYSLIQDVGPLRHLKNLVCLNLRKNFSLCDVSLLSHITNLRNLNLSYTSVGDIYYLKTLKNLEKLNIRHTNVQDYSVLRYLGNFKYLDMKGVFACQSFRFIRHLTNLLHLNLSYIRKPDLYVLDSLPHLNVLILKHVNIENIDALQKLHTLTKLNLEDNKIQNIDVLIYKIQNIDVLTHRIYENAISCLHFYISSVNKLHQSKSIVYVYC